jgi:hypothetical protein
VAVWQDLQVTKFNHVLYPGFEKSEEDREGERVGTDEVYSALSLVQPCLYTEDVAVSNSLVSGAVW